MTELVCKSEKDKQGHWNRTSVIGLLHVEPCWIRHKIFRSRFLGSIVHFADFLANDEIEALTRDLFVTSGKAFRQFNIACFKSVASEEHSSNGFFLYLTVGSSFKQTNSEHQHKREPEFGFHIGMRWSVSRSSTSEIKAFKVTC